MIIEVCLLLVIASAAGSIGTKNAVQFKKLPSLPKSYKSLPLLLLYKNKFFK
jgi:hypothetical protein